MSRIGVAYLRCSDPRQDKSIDQQREEIAKRAAADGVIIPPQNWFIDEGISGKSTKKRVAYKMLLARAEEQKKAIDTRDRQVVRIDVLYVWGISRIARNMYDALKALGALDDAKIDVISLSEPDSGDASFRKLIRPILAWLAERYIEELKKNVLRGMSSQAEKGFWLHPHIPYGYRANESTRTDPDGPARLEVDPEPADVIRRIRDMRLVDMLGQRHIAEQLSRERIATPSREDMKTGKAENYFWEAKHIKRIMLNPAYTGSIVFTPRDAHGGPTGEGMIVCKNAHEALMTEEDQAADARLCQARTKSRVTVSTVKRGERGIFTTRLVCGTCRSEGTIQTGGSPKRPSYSYVCQGRETNRESCTGFSVRVDQIDPLLRAQIEADVLSPEGLTELVRASLAHLLLTPDIKLAERRCKLTEDERELTKKIGRVVAAIEDADDASDLQTRLRQLQMERTNVRDDLAALPVPGPLPDTSAVSIEAFRTTLLAAWAGKDVQEKRKALHKLVSSIVIDPAGTATIKYAWQGEGTYGVQSPCGPPWGSWGQWECEVSDEAVRRPKCRAEATL